MIPSNQLSSPGFLKAFVGSVGHPQQPPDRSRIQRVAHVEKANMSGAAARAPCKKPEPQGHPVDLRLSLVHVTSIIQSHHSLPVTSIIPGVTGSESLTQLSPESSQCFLAITSPKA